jgi:serine/threonine-protein kinase
MSGPTLPSDAQTRCPHCPELHPAIYTHCPNTGRSLSVGSALIGRVIAGRYRIVGQLGEGGMGEVFVAEHLMIGRKVAIKRLHPELVSDERAVQRFQREARAAAATGHEHIVEVLDLGYADDNAPYLVMEYLRGQSLADVIKREGRLTPQRTCHLLGQVLAALEAVHRQEIIHRDLKPDNVFITRRPGMGEFVKVLDFGISKMKEENGEALHLTRTGMMMGTPFYMSPEQARGVRDVDHRVDLYAVGVMLYECLTGRLPFSSDNYHALLQQILRSEPKKPSDFAPLVEPALDAITLRSIGKDPALRFGSAVEFAQALQPFGATVRAAASPMLPYSEPPPNPANLPTAVQVAVPQAPRAASGALPVPTGANSWPTGERSAEGSPSAARPRPTPGPGGGARHTTPRYYFAASDDWQPERARASSVGPPVSLGVRDVDEPGTEPMRALGPKSQARAFADPTLVDPPSSPSFSVSALSGGSPAPPMSALPSTNTPSIATSPTLARSEAALRGSFFVGALEYLEHNQGADKLAALTGRMPQAAAERITGVILPMAWLPLATFELLLAAAGGGEPLAIGVGRAIADRELTTTHRLFVQTATTQTAVDRFPHLFKLYHLRGVAALDEADPQGVRFAIDIGSPEPVTHAQVMVAFLGRMLEICGAREVRSAVVACRGRGDAKTILSCRFR